MRIITARRIAQVFFLLVFLWFCVTTTLGDSWWRLRGWPVNWFLQLDPLVGLGVLLATHTLYAGLLWGVLTIILTLFLGRAFCGWVCPMGAIQQGVGYLGLRRQRTAHKIQRNQPHAGQRLKYWLLLFLLAAAAADLLQFIFSGPLRHPLFFWSFLAGMTLLLGAMTRLNVVRIEKKTLALVLGVIICGVGLQWRFAQSHWLVATLQTGLLDPLPFLYRAVNLVLLPIVDAPLHVTSTNPRLYAGAGSIGLLFLAILLLCLRVPRFYCRFICPLGALLGWLSRWALWRMGKSEQTCRACRRCEAHCEGACAPTEVILTSECVLCLNCMDHCRHRRMGYRSLPSAGGEQVGPDLTRRHVISAVAAGLAAGPMMRIGGALADHWDAQLIRPPGALNEAGFLSRCIKCGQCMRICPTNVIHPATWEAGMEGLWTPVLNFRIGTSGCQHNCVACSHVCPTAALRPLSVDERMGRNQYQTAGPLRTGMAFIDRGRCLPWAMDTPCIVCQENCPVSPKAIFTRTEYRPIRNGQVGVAAFSNSRITLDRDGWEPDALASGDHFVLGIHRSPVPIKANSKRELVLDGGIADDMPSKTGHSVQIAVRLQKPYIDPRRCIGCGVCEHECPVQGRRAIRISAENESRHPGHRMLISGYSVERVD